LCQRTNVVVRAALSLILSAHYVGLVDGLTTKLVLPRGVGEGGGPGFQAVPTPESL